MYIRSVELLEGHFAGEDAYLASIPAIRGMGKLDLSARPVTFFVGENGSGKSTLLEAVAVAAGFNPEGGSSNLRFATADTHSGLHRHMKLVREPVRPRDGYFLRAESFYNMASALDEVDDLNRGYGGKSLHRQSHGESFLALVVNRLGGRGLYIFDEPEAALSPARQLALLCEMHRLVQNRSQLLIATHSPILMAYPEAVIYRLDESGVGAVAYEDTEHYAITRSFLQNPKRMLDILFDAGGTAQGR